MWRAANKLGVEESTLAGNERFPDLKIKCIEIDGKHVHILFLNNVKKYLKLQLAKIAFASGACVISCGFEPVCVNIKDC